MVENLDRNGLLAEFAAWVDTWVSNPVSSYSVAALDGIFAATRDRLSAIAASTEQEGAGAVRVKALEWRHLPDAFPPMWVTKTTIGSYHIEEAAGSDSPSFDLFNPMAGPMGNYDGLPEAKAAAQADYEKRIRSALVGGRNDA